MKPESENTEHYHISIIRDGELQVSFGQHMDVSTADVLFNSLLSDISKYKPRKLTLDLATTNHLDEYGMLVIMELQEMIDRADSNGVTTEVGLFKQDIAADHRSNAYDNGDRDEARYLAATNVGDQVRETR